MSGRGGLRLFAAPRPTAAIEIASRRITTVALSRGAHGFAVAAHATEPLPAGAIVPSLTGANIPDRAVVAGALGRALERMGGRPRRVALVVPDSVAKVSLLKFDKVPPRAADLDQLVRWQVRKAAPFRLEEAQVSYTAGAVAPEGGREFVVVVARRETLQEYEAVCAAAGAHAGVVDLASFNLINVVVAASRSTQRHLSPVGDWLLVHVTPEYSTLAIVRGDDLIFFRNRPTAEGDLADLVHQTTMYYEDRLGGSGFVRVILAGASAGGTLPPAQVDGIRRELEERLGGRVEAIDPRGAAGLTDRIVATPDLLDALAAPVGVVVREQVA